MSFSSERRLGLPRSNGDLSRFQIAAQTDESDSEGGGAYYDSEDEEERLLSHQHGEAQDVDERKSGGKKRKPTDAEIAAEYNDSKKVKSNKPRRKKVIDETDLTKPDGLSYILLNFPRQFHQKHYKKNRKDMAKFSSQLVSAYQEWANRIVPGTPLEEVLWTLQTLNSKTSVKRFLQTMRNQVRNEHVERIFGLEKAEQMLSHLEEDSHGQEGLWNGSTGAATSTTAPREPPDDTDALPSSTVVPVNTATPSAQEQQRTVMTTGNPTIPVNEDEDEEDYIDMNDMVPMEEYEDHDFDMADMIPLDAETSRSKTVVAAATPIVNTVTPSAFKNNRRRVLDDDDDDEEEKVSSDEEELEFEDVHGVAPAAKTPLTSRRAILEDSDEEDEGTNGVEVPAHTIAEAAFVANTIDTPKVGPTADESAKVDTDHEHFAPHLSNSIGSDTGGVHSGAIPEEIGTHFAKPTTPPDDSLDEEEFVVETHP